MWYALQVKDNYDRPFYYREIASVLKSRYGKTDNDLFIDGNGERANSICCYVFVREDGDMSSLWRRLSREKYFVYDTRYIGIGDREMEEMVSGCHRRSSPDASFGDIIRATNGVHRKMYGIVMSGSSTDGYDIAFKLFTGTIVRRLKPQDIEVVRSLFETFKNPVH